MNATYQTMIDLVLCYRSSAQIGAMARLNCGQICAMFRRSLAAGVGDALSGRFYRKHAALGRSCRADIADLFKREADRWALALSGYAKRRNLFGAVEDDLRVESERLGGTTRI